MKYITAVLIAVIFCCGCSSKKESAATWPNGQWQRYTIDDSSQGADGTRYADINGDGLLDITTPWEQGGEIRVYIYPGETDIRKPWPKVTVGQVGDPEDSFFVDLDGDGFIDVISNCEGSTKAIFVHWSPKDSNRLLDPTAWKQKSFRSPPDSVVGCTESPCRWTIKTESIWWLDAKAVTSVGSNLQRIRETWLAGKCTLCWPLVGQ
jgi:hypothetical protein